MKDKSTKAKVPAFRLCEFTNNLYYIRYILTFQVCFLEFLLFKIEKSRRYFCAIMPKSLHQSSLFKVLIQSS